MSYGAEFFLQRLEKPLSEADPRWRWRPFLPSILETRMIDFLALSDGRAAEILSNPSHPAIVGTETEAAAVLSFLKWEIKRLKDKANWDAMVASATRLVQSLGSEKPTSDQLLLAMLVNTALKEKVYPAHYE